MTLLLRAIVAAEDAGVAADLGLRSVSGTRTAALAAAWDAGRAAGEAELLDHHRVVQAVFERVPCLPARFGSVFADEEALHARLALREADLAAQLIRLGHRCELAITCAWREPDVLARATSVPTPSGRAYLERGLILRGERLVPPGVRRRSLPACSASWRSSQTASDTGFALDRLWPFQCPPWSGVTRSTDSVRAWNVSARSSAT